MPLSIIRASSALTSGTAWEVLPKHLCIILATLSVPYNHTKRRSMAACSGDGREKPNRDGNLSAHLSGKGLASEVSQLHAAVHCERSLKKPEKSPRGNGRAGERGQHHTGSSSFEMTTLNCDFCLNSLDGLYHQCQKCPNFRYCASCFPLVWAYYGYEFDERWAGDGSGPGPGLSSSGPD